MANRIRDLPRIEYDKEADAVYIQLSNEPIGYTKELDDNRLIDYTDSGEPVGIDLSSVSKGVKLEGLPEAEATERILVDLDVTVCR